MSPKAESLHKFFSKRSSTGWRGGGRRRTFGSLTPEDVFKVLQDLSEDVGPIEDLVKFVKGHKKIARELTLEEIEEVVDTFSTQEVLDA